MRTGFVCVVLYLLVGQAWADPLEDADQLRKEATETLKANAKQTVPPQDYAMAVYRLEKAQSILQEAGEAKGALPQEVNAALFWARRCSNVHIMKELDKIHASNPPLKLASESKRQARKLGQGEIDIQEEAKAAFEEAQEFAKAHKRDDYMVALRYFQMANEHPGTDYAMKAMSLAAEAQMRFAINTGVMKEELPDTPEMKPVKEGDALAAKGELEKAFELYKASIKMKDTLIAHRRLGHAYFLRAQQMKDGVNTKFEEFAPKYKEAYEAAWYMVGHGPTAQKGFNANHPAWLAARQRHAALLKEASDAMLRYMYGQWEFEKVLKMASGNKDFDAAAYTALSLTARLDNRIKALDTMRKFLKDYEPSSETERFVYEFCKTEMERAGKG